MTAALMNATAAERSVAGDVAFVTTHWSVVLTAQSSSPAAREALDTLCHTYWWPVYSFVRREGYGIADAQDLTQGFFARLLHRNDFDSVRREKGRLRSYLLISLKHFLVSEWKRASAVKRGEGRPMVSLDELIAHEREDPEPVDQLTADRIFERRWAMTVLDRVMERLGREYAAAGNTPICQRFAEVLGGEGISHAQIGSECGMSENAAKQAYHRFRQRYRELLREEIAHTVVLPGDIEDELRHLIAVLRS